MERRSLSGLRSHSGSISCRAGLSRWRQQSIGARSGHRVLRCLRIHLLADCTSHCEGGVALQPPSSRAPGLALRDPSKWLSPGVYSARRGARRATREQLSASPLVPKLYWERTIPRSCTSATWRPQSSDTPNTSRQCVNIATADSHIGRSSTSRNRAFPSERDCVKRLHPGEG